MYVREAVETDNSELIELQSRCPQGTKFVASVVNAPDFFTRARVHEDHKIYVACDDGRITGSIACTVRNGYVGGRVERLGRVFQLFVDPSYRGQRIAGQLIQACEGYLTGRGALLSYGYIVEDNLPSIRNIQRQGYSNHRTLSMPGIPVYREMKIPDMSGIRSVTPGDLPALVRLLDKTWRGHDLYEPASEQKLGRLFSSTPGFSYENTFVLEEGGELRCCLGCWDIARVMRMKVEALSFGLRAAGLLLNLGRVFLPLPRPPKAGEVLEQVIIEPIAFSEPAYVPVLLKYINNLAYCRRIKQIFFGCEKGSPLFRSLKGFIHLDVNMQIYVKYLKSGITLGHNPVYMTGLDL